MDNLAVYGGKTSLIYADGASVMAKENNFTRIGHLNEVYQNFTQDIGLDDKATYLPVYDDPWSNRTWTQSRGIFWLRSGARDANLTTP